MCAHNCQHIFINYSVDVIISCCSSFLFDFAQISTSKQQTTGTWIWASTMTKVNVHDQIIVNAVIEEQRQTRLWLCVSPQTEAIWTPEIMCTCALRGGCGTVWMVCRDASRKSAALSALQRFESRTAFIFILYCSDTICIVKSAI